MTNNTNDLSAMLTASRAATAARDELTALLTHTDCDFARTDECQHDIAAEMLRDYLISDSEDIDLDYYHNTLDEDIIDAESLAAHIFELLSLIADDRFSTQYLSNLRLEFSICPMHHCDYAICFDDNDPECATIRAYFPDHDT